jgi:hypothetical protein
VLCRTCCGSCCIHWVKGEAAPLRCSNSSRTPSFTNHGDASQYEAFTNSCRSTTKQVEKHQQWAHNCTISCGHETAPSAVNAAVRAGAAYLKAQSGKCKLVHDDDDGPQTCTALTGQGQRCFGGSVSAVCRGTDTMISSAVMSFLAARPRTPSNAAGCSLGNSTPAMEPTG